MADFIKWFSALKDIVKVVERLSAVVDEVSSDMTSVKKQVFRKKVQTVSMKQMQRALCIDTMDPLLRNRVRFFHPILHAPETPLRSLPWAKPVSPFGGHDDCGVSWIPPAGSTLVMFFENGHRNQPYYFGTTWHYDRGPGGQDFPIPVPEFEFVSKGHRGGYLVGPNDESQVYAPWNTESGNGRQYNSFTEFSRDAEEQQRRTIPNIYGMKTPEKHMIKMVDGDPKCNRRWKRLEIMSSCGNWFMMKDDHMHYGGQWSHPSCPPPSESANSEDVSQCAQSSGRFPFFTDPYGNPLEKPTCEDKNILGGTPSTPGNPVEGEQPTPHYKSQGGANKYFKNKNECRPYRGPGTPQNNQCDLPQTGVQILSIGGHSMVFDDSVEEPEGIPYWERSTEDFSFGCTDKCMGLMYMKSMTGHRFVMSDVESSTNVRGEKNYIELVSAHGNKIQLNDHTIGGQESECQGCPPNYAGEKRGIHIESTSKHQIVLCDHMNEQCAPCRKEGGLPEAKATQAYLLVKSGYGCELRIADDNSQEQTQSQYLQLLNPQQAVNSLGDQTANTERGPHWLMMQARPQGQAGIVFLRAGGHHIRYTYDSDVVLVGDKEKNPSDKFTYVSRMCISSVEDLNYQYTGELHIFFAEKYILLMAGRDCAPAEGNKCAAPCLFPVVVGRCPWVCPLTGAIHWTEKALSERVFASAYSECVTCGSGDCPQGQSQPCTEDEDEEDQQ